jgi:hypothetical protein
MMAGADLNALDSADQSPFANMMLSPRSWLPETLADATRKWGELLQKAGVSLQDFLENENRLLARPGGIPTEVRIFEQGYNRKTWTCQLVMGESTTLAIEVGSSLDCLIWEFRPPPGSWSIGSGHVDKIIWPPSLESEGHDWQFWQATDRFVINLASRLLSRPQVVAPLAEGISASWRDLAAGVQDDHGFVATAVRRTSTTSGKQKKRRRAASLPPPITVYGRHDLPAAESALHFNSSRWRSEPHKCPLHLIWKFACQSRHYVGTDYRRCMQGRCDDDKDIDWSDSYD